MRVMELLKKCLWPLVDEKQEDEEVAKFLQEYEANKAKIASTRKEKEMRMADMLD